MIVTERYRHRGVVHVYGHDKATVRTFHHKAMDAMYMVDFMHCVDKLATLCQIKLDMNTNGVTLLKFELDGTMGWASKQM